MACFESFLGSTLRHFSHFPDSRKSLIRLCLLTAELLRIDVTAITAISICDESLLNYVLYVLSCPTCLVLYVPSVLRAIVPHVPRTLRVVVTRVPRALVHHVLRTLRALVLQVPRALRALVLHVPFDLRGLVLRGLLLPTVISNLY